MTERPKPLGLLPGSAPDARAGPDLLRKLGKRDQPIPLLVDPAYEGCDTRKLAVNLGYVLVIQPKKNRLDPWEPDREMYKPRIEVEFLFRRIECFRRIFSQLEKLAVIFIAFINSALIAD